jgi:hypothetical protein
MTGIKFHGDALLVEVNINWLQIVQVVQSVYCRMSKPKASLLFKEFERFEQL